MPMLPVLPVLDGESLTSYLNRAALFHSNMDVYRFLSFIEFSRVASMAPTREHLERLERLFGVPMVRLEQMTFLPCEQRMRSICGEAVHAEFANFDQTTFCPACLLEDSAPGSASHGIRVGRIHWRIEAVRTCDRHGIALFRRKNTGYPEKFQKMDEVAPSDADLQKMVRDAPKQDVSGLQSYILARLKKENGPSWLDEQPLDLAARACEMLGLALTFENSKRLGAMSLADWNLAGDKGFEYASQGEEGICAALDEVRLKFNGNGDVGGPQKIFGGLYKWLQFSRGNKPVGPIRNVVREYLLNNFPIPEGQVLFGKAVARQRVHSVHSLAGKTGDHPKTVHRIMVSMGLILGDPERPAAGNVFDLDAGEAIMARVGTSMFSKELREFLNCTRMQAETLVKSGVIQRLFGGEEASGYTLKAVAKEDAQEFLETLLQAARKVDVAGPGMVDIATAAVVSRWPVVDIVKGILSQQFDSIEIVDERLKFKGVLVHPMEVRKSLSCDMLVDHVGVDEASQILDIKPHLVPTLERLERLDGGAYSRTKYVSNSKGVRVALYSVRDMRLFLSENVSLKQSAKAVGTSLKNMKIGLDKAGLRPIAARAALEGFWYRRQEIEALNLREHGSSDVRGINALTPHNLYP